MSFDIFARNFASKAIREVGDDAERSSRKLDTLGRSGQVLGGHMSGLTGHLKGLGGGLAGLAGQIGSAGASLVAGAAQMSLLGTAAASAASSAAGLAAALAPAGGIITALPGALALGAAAMATFKVAVIGVGDAFGAALGEDAKKFEESLKNLSPAAQSVARELRYLKPELDGIRSAVQDSLFAPLQGQLVELVAALGGPVRDGMSAVASEFGQAGAQAAAFARSADSVAAVQRIFSDLQSAVAGLRPALEPLLAGFRDLAVVGSSFSAGLVPGIAAAAAQFGEFLSRAAASGQALAWMDNALVVIKALGSIAKDVGGILTGVFGAMRSAGGGALGVVGQLIDKFNTWINSARGQDVLVQLFRSLSQAGQALFPVIEALASGLAMIAPQAAAVATAFGPVLSAAVSALAPAVAALGPGLVAVADALARAFASPAVAQGLLALGTGISNLLIAVSPLIPPLVELAAILVERLGNNLTLLAAFLQPVVSALADVLAPILPEIAALFREVSAAVLPVAQQLGGELAAALRDTSSMAGPVIDALREVGRDVLAELRTVLPQVTPYLGDLARAFTAVFLEVVKLLPDLIRFGGEILVELIRQLPILAPMVVDLAMAFLDCVREITPLVPPLLKLLLEIVKPLIPELPKLIPPLIELVRVFAELMREASPLIKKLLESPEAFAAVKFLAANGVLALNTLRDAFNFVLGAAQTFLGVLFGMPSQVDAGLGRIGNSIKSWLNSVIGWFESVINNLASAVPGMSRISLPRLADGGIIRRQMLAVVGEAGPEVVIPLTRPGRAVELARESGLLDLLAKAAPNLSGSLGAGTVAALAAGGRRSAPVVVRGGSTFQFNFAGQPLIGQDEIARMFITALNQAVQQGFNLGAIGGTS